MRRLVYVFIVVLFTTKSTRSFDILGSEVKFFGKDEISEPVSIKTHLFDGSMRDYACSDTNTVRLYSHNFSENSTCLACSGE